MIGIAILEKKNRGYHIENKIISMTLDNERTSSGSIDLVRNMIPLNIHGNFFCIRCACRVLNLLLQDDLRFI